MLTLRDVSPPEPVWRETQHLIILAITNEDNQNDANLCRPTEALSQEEYFQEDK
ncbi:hypothetical protein PtA15_17A210 [Puccinia triticina]|uniref:Uncharacterized protein n=1 Tax=Puccinia triticina TaxID=208348 RepID=A0ABY7D830_9BASI|nr:uncharacterized protein PtA15_17A210 [Puccinia triticina]WAQ92728.1 hypothetical protein PtA15_17A210 [Puccinia triticina]